MHAVSVGDGVVHVAVANHDSVRRSWRSLTVHSSVTHVHRIRHRQVAWSHRPSVAVLVNVHRESLVADGETIVSDGISRRSSVRRHNRVLGIGPVRVTNAVERRWLSIARPIDWLASRRRRSGVRIHWRASWRSVWVVTILVQVRIPVAIAILFRIAIACRWRIFVVDRRVTNAGSRIRCHRITISWHWVAVRGHWITVHWVITIGARHHRVTIWCHWIVRIDWAGRGRISLHSWHSLRVAIASHRRAVRIWVVAIIGIARRLVSVASAIRQWRSWIAVVLARIHSRSSGGRRVPSWHGRGISWGVTVVWIVITITTLCWVPSHIRSSAAHRVSFRAHC